MLNVLKNYYICSGCLHFSKGLKSVATKTSGVFIYIDGAPLFFISGWVLLSKPPIALKLLNKQK